MAILKQSEAVAIVQRFEGKRVGVIGDLMLDRYTWGTASRISQEAPVPVVAVNRESAAPGGAANVLRNLACLGASPVAFGVIGKDRAGTELVELLSEDHVDTHGVVKDLSRMTTIKTRVIADHQQIVRVDREQALPLSEETNRLLVKNITKAIDNNELDAIVFEDYAKGVISKKLLSSVSQHAASKNIPIALDPHPGNTVLTTGLTLMTPNRSEAFNMAGIYPSPGVMPIDHDRPLMDVVDYLQKSYAPKHLLITLGGAGMALFTEGEEPHHIKTQAKEVFDVSGAGDTVIASYLLSIVAGATPVESASIANHAAGIVVAKVGTVPATVQELLESFHS
jgi:D-beta-D-heptose 7-phosphate kinase/D-beta-D-heptose 1-phosphate adenosyltransferase